MMTRAERIEYEILDCALNRSFAKEGWATSLQTLVLQLHNLFPDIDRGELVEACKRLAMSGALIVRKQGPNPDAGYDDYHGEHDDQHFFRNDRDHLRFQKSPLSGVHFRNLAARIELPPGFKGWRKQARSDARF
jgi:hypothetical protein